MKKKICILDYGLGNIKSLYNALKVINCEVFFFSEKKNINYDFIFIPGVGSFSKASNLIKKKNVQIFIKKNYEKVKFFGICLGMQIAFDFGNENSFNRGLSLLNGNVEKIKSTRKIILPIVGFKKIFLQKKIKFLSKFNNEKFYFCHSYECLLKNKKNLLFSTKDQGHKYCAAVINKNFIGTQFHPEKSGSIGLNFLKDVIDNF